MVLSVLQMVLSVLQIVLSVIQIFYRFLQIVFLGSFSKECIKQNCITNIFSYHPNSQEQLQTFFTCFLLVLVAPLLTFAS